MEKILRKMKRVVVLALALLGATVLLVTFTPIVMWWSTWFAGEFNHPQGEVLITLGGAESTIDGLIADDTLVRSIYTVRAYREYRYPVIILSGGSKRGAAPVSVNMKDYLISEGVPENIIRTEERSISTRTNAIETARMLQTMPGRRVLLTSDYHMFRAARVFRKVGIEVLPRPVPDVVKRAGTWRGRWPAFIDLSMESAKIIYYFLRGWI